MTDMRDQSDLESHLSSVKDRARSSFLVLGTSNALWQIISWMATLITARILMPSDYGLVALVETVVPYLAFITEFNISSWLVQRKSVSEELLRSTQTVLLIVSVVVCASLFFAAPSIAHFYGNPALATVLRVVAVVFLLRGWSIIPDALLRRDLLFRPIAAIQIGSAIARVILQLSLAYLGFGYWALIIGMVCKDVVATAALVIYRGGPKKLHWDLAVVCELVHFGLPATLSSVCWVLYSTADNITVGKLFGTEVLGFYAMAFFLTDLPMSKINAAVGPVLMPLFSQLKTSSMHLQETFLQIVRTLAGIIFPLLGGLAAVGYDAVPLILGEKWAPMITPLVVLCAAGMFRTVVDQFANLLLSLGQPRVLLTIYLLTVLSMPLSFYVLGSMFGLIGIYAAWLLVYPAIVVVMLKVLDAKGIVSDSLYLKNLISPFMGTAIMVAVTVVAGGLMRPILTPWPTLVAEIVIGVATYSITLRLYDASYASELLSLPQRLLSRRAVNEN